MEKGWDTAMAKKKQKKKKSLFAWLLPPKKEARRDPAVSEPEVAKDFLDMIAPAAVRFNSDQYILGNSYRAVYAVRSYGTSTEELALLRDLGCMNGVTLTVYARRVGPAEEDSILHNAANKNRMNQNANDIKSQITASSNLQDVEALIARMHKNNEKFLHCAVFIELSAFDPDALRKLQDEILGDLVRMKINADRILLRQQEGFKAVNPMGYNIFASLYERVLPASSVANLYPFNYSGKTDPHGFYIGGNRNGASVIVDLDRRAEDKTTASVLILGNSGQGKSYLLKLLMVNCLEAGKTVISLDAEQELPFMTKKLNGCYIDLTNGEYRINPLEPKLWSVDDVDDMDETAPAAFRKRSRLSQHISFLKDFFRAYKDFSDRHIDTIELILERMYHEWGMSDETDFSAMGSEDYPILSDLYTVIEHAYQHYEEETHPLYPKDLLQEVLLGLRSMCVGAESIFFNGHTNITSDRFLVFGVKELIQGNSKVKDAVLFNVLSFLSDKLLTEGNTVATLDELYIWLSSRTTVEYIRNMLKRVRKKNSSLMMASQNLEDFDSPGIREMTRPLFAIPTHQFIFNCGNIDKSYYMENLQIDESEYELVKNPQRGVCLYKCGIERFLLEVKAPEYKEALFGAAGGK